MCQFVRSDHDATHAKPSKESEDGSKSTPHLLPKRRKQPQQEEIEVDASPTEQRRKRSARAKARRRESMP